MKLSTFIYDKIKPADWSGFLLAVAVIACLMGSGMHVVSGNISGSAGKFLRIDFVPGVDNAGAGSKHGRFILSFNGQISAKASRESSIPLFYVDVLGATIDSNPFVMNFEHGPAKLVRLSQISLDPPVLRATFFLRRSLAPEVKKIQSSLEISFADAEEKNGQNAKESYSLIKPLAKQNYPADSALKEAAVPMAKELENALATRIKMTGADVSAVLKELARQAGKTIHFRDSVQNRIDLDVSAETPADAMHKIVADIGAKVTIEDGDIWVSRLENPLLKISDSDYVEGADLSKLALGDVLRALGQIAELNIALDKSMDAVKDGKVDIYLQKTSVRRAFETLLKVNELVLNIIDDKSLLVMTLEKARQIEGKVARVMPVQVPLEKIKAMVLQTLSKELVDRVVLQEDLGNLILTGDKEAVDAFETTVKSLEGKMLSAGEAFAREYFHPLNIKPDDLIKLVNENIDKTENIKISTDKRTDMILVSGPSSSVARALELIKKLDKDPTRQALIRIKLVEITSTDLEQMGIKFPDQLVSTDDIANFKASSIVIPAGFTAFQDNNRIKTLANPTLRCMDKEEASIDISEQIPVKNSITEYLPVASASLAARTSDNWTTSEVGIKLNVQPFIHKDNEITMKVDVDLTELVSLVEGHPWTARRVIKTMVRVKDNETVVIGGLIRNKKNTQKRPVPLLSKIPILRRLLRRIEHTQDSTEKGEMVILITPTVVTSSGISCLENQSEVSRPALMSKK
ncbi:MAG: secretin N-terminal domain-containing protein [Candidatus Riflebacteria bacterium]|nr:secretin N-terminal domain-containing protein [Candidatus Riflebacteria bacterium]